MNTHANPQVAAPGRYPFDGVLFVDMEGERAKYECLRPNCPHRLEGPVSSADRDSEGRRRGAGWVTYFVDNVKSKHLAQYHGSTR